MLFYSFIRSYTNLWSMETAEKLDCAEVSLWKMESLWLLQVVHFCVKRAKNFALVIFYLRASTETCNVYKLSNRSISFKFNSNHMQIQPVHSVWLWSIFFLWNMQYDALKWENGFSWLSTLCKLACHPSTSFDHKWMVKSFNLLNR